MNAEKSEKTILIADDDDVTRDMLQLILEKSGYHVFAVASGELALKKFQMFIYDIDLVILDQLMPKMSGVQVFEKMAERRPTLPCLFCTGAVTDRLRDYCRNKESVVAVEKPYKFDDLLKSIQQLLLR